MKFPDMKKIFKIKKDGSPAKEKGTIKNYSSTPYICMHDLKAKDAIEFYKSEIGFIEKHRMTYKEVLEKETREEMKSLLEKYPEAIYHCDLDFNGATVMIADVPNEYCDSEKGSKATVTIIISVNEPSRVDELTRLFSKEGSIVEEPHNMFWGARMASVKDKFGVAWGIYCLHAPVTS